MKTFVKRIAAVLATATVALLVVGSATAGTAQAKPRELDWYPCVIDGKPMKCSDGPF